MTEQSHRFFIGATTTTYTHEDFEARPELADEVHRMAGLFVSELDYQRVPGFGVDMSAADLKARLGGFLTSRDRSSADLVAFYYTGHAAVVDDDFVLPFPETTKDLARTGVWATELATWLLRGTTVQRFLIILDTCSAGRGAGVLATGAIDYLDRLRGLAREPNVAIIAAARPWEQAASAAFSRAFVAAVRATAGRHDTPFLPLDAVVDSVQGETPPWQHARLFHVGDTITEFIRNPRHDRRLREVDRRADLDRRQQMARQVDRQVHVLPRARGVDTVSDDVWLFTGRHAALRRLSGWLSATVDGHGTLVVTGAPGSGKSALLARFYMLADPQLRQRVPRLDRLPKDTIPPIGSVKTFIHARGLTPEQVLAGLAEATGVEEAASAGDLLAALARRPWATTVIIDAVDEAGLTGASRDDQVVNPLVDELLAPLIRGAPRSKLRLLLGARRHLLARLASQLQTVDLDDSAYADPDSVRVYARRCLLDLVPDTPYRGLPDAVVDGVAEAVARAAGGSFLVALISARSLALRPHPVDLSDATWQRDLPRLAADAMRLDLDHRLDPRDVVKARDLLLPLAYAEGAGLPWENVWPTLATALARRRYTCDDIDWLIERAGCYIDQGHSGHRVYHEALAEHLREGRDQPADQRQIVDTLTAITPTGAAGGSDWGDAHPYVRAHMATHAVRAGAIDHLLVQPEFLLTADRASLLPALAGAAHPDARAAAAAYRQAIHHLRTKPIGEHVAYLELAAHCSRAPVLVAAITSLAPQMPWSTRWASWQPYQPHRPLTGHTGEVTALAAGELDRVPVVVTGGDDATIRMWDLTTGNPVGGPFIGHQGWVWSLVVTTVDNRPVVVSGSEDRTVRLWDLATGTPLTDPLVGHTAGVTAVTTAELGGRTVLVSGGRDGTARVWDPATGRPVGEPLLASTDSIWCLAVWQRDDDAVLLAGGRDGTVRMWDLSTGRPIGEPLMGHADWVWSLAVATVDGRPVFVSGSDDHTLRIWDLATRRPTTGPLTGHAGGVMAVATATLAGRPVVVSAGRDATVRVWDLATGRSAGGPYTGHTAQVAAVVTAMRNERPVAVTASRDATVRVWELDTGRPVTGPFAGHTAGITAVVATEIHGRQVVVTGSDDCTVRVWDGATGQPVREPLTGHDEGVIALAIADLDGRPVVVSGSADHTARVWDLATGEPLGPPLTGHTDVVTAVATADLDGRPVVISGSADHTARVWDLATGHPLGPPFAGHLDSITALAVASLNGHSIVVSSARDTTVHAWRLDTRTPIPAASTHHGCQVHALAVSTLDGRPVVTAGRADRRACVWDLATGEPIVDAFICHDAAVTAVAASELGDRQVLFTASTDRTVRAWDLRTGASIGAPAMGHTAGVTSLAVTGPRGRPSVVSGSRDQTARVWDRAVFHTADGPFAGHAGGVPALAITDHDGTPTLISAGTDHTLRVWNLDTGASRGGPLTGHTSGVTALAVADLRGRQLVVSGGDRTIRLWDLATGKPVGEPITGHQGGITSLLVATPHGQPIVISGGRDATIRAWDLASGRPIGTPLRYNGGVTALAIADVGGRPILLSGGQDATIRAWDLTSGTPLGVHLAGHAATITTLAVAELDGRPVVVSGSADTTVRVQEITPGQQPRRQLWPRRHPGSAPIRELRCGDVVRSVSYHPVSQRLAIAAGTTIQLYSLTTGEVRSIDPEAPVLSIALCDPMTLVAGTARGLIVLDVGAGP